MVNSELAQLFDAFMANFTLEDVSDECSDAIHLSAGWDPGSVWDLSESDTPEEGKSEEQDPAPLTWPLPFLVPADVSVRPLGTFSLLPVEGAPADTGRSSSQANRNETFGQSEPIDTTTIGLAADLTENEILRFKRGTPSDSHPSTSEHLAFAAELTRSGGPQPATAVMPVKEVADNALEDVADDALQEPAAAKRPIPAVGSEHGAKAYDALSRTPEDQHQDERISAVKVVSEHMSFTPGMVSAEHPAADKTTSRPQASHPTGVTETVRMTFEEPAAVRSPEPVQQLSIDVRGDSDTRVRVRIAESHTGLRVAVTGGQHEVIERVRTHLPELVQSLDDRGFASEIWTPDHVARTGEAAELGSSADQGGGSHDPTTTGNHEERDERQRRRPHWLDEFQEGDGTSLW
jgi:hypothetical protein